MFYTYTKLYAAILPYQIQVVGFNFQRLIIIFLILVFSTFTVRVSGVRKCTVYGFFTDWFIYNIYTGFESRFIRRLLFRTFRRKLHAISGVTTSVIVYILVNSAVAGTMPPTPEPGVECFFFFFTAKSIIEAPDFNVQSVNANLNENRT